MRNIHILIPTLLIIIQVGYFFIYEILINNCHHPDCSLCTELCKVLKVHKYLVGILFALGLCKCKRITIPLRLIIAIIDFVATFFIEFTIYDFLSPIISFCTLAIEIWRFFPWSHEQFVRCGDPPLLHIHYDSLSPTEVASIRKVQVACEITCRRYELSGKMQNKTQGQKEMWKDKDNKQEEHIDISAYPESMRTESINRVVLAMLSHTKFGPKLIEMHAAEEWFKCCSHVGTLAKLYERLDEIEERLKKMPPPPAPQSFLSKWFGNIFGCCITNPTINITTGAAPPEPVKNSSLVCNTGTPSTVDICAAIEIHCALKRLGETGIDKFTNKWLMDIEKTKFAYSKPFNPCRDIRGKTRSLSDILKSPIPSPIDQQENQGQMNMGVQDQQHEESTNFDPSAVSASYTIYRLDQNEVMYRY